MATFEKNNVWKMFNDAVQAALTMTATPAEAMKKAQTEADKILEAYQNR